MKLQALLVAIAVAATGSAFAAGTSKAGSVKSGDTQTVAQKKVVKKTKKTKRKMTHAQSSMSSSMRHMGAAAAPETDLNARDRQGRMDEAYDKWRASNPSAS